MTNTPKKKKRHTFYAIYSVSYGNGPLHETLGDAEKERHKMLDKDPEDTIYIYQHKMLIEDYLNLPEHEGY